MASIKKNYSFSNKKNIWRLIPSESGYLVIEERDMISKEVFFNCLKTEDGKVYFQNFQLEEKYWVGIEAIYKNIIIFHKFRKPDMPGHKGVYAFDILSRKLIWQNDDLIFLLAKDEQVYAYQTSFEGREYFVLHYLTGELIKDLGSEFNEVNKLREESMRSDFVNNFLFPEKFIENAETQSFAKLFNQQIVGQKVIGDINWLEQNGLVMFNYHEQNSNGTFNNHFSVVDISKGKIILNEILNSNSKSLTLESFFIIENLLFLLVGKTKLVVYRIMQ